MSETQTPDQKPDQIPPETALDPVVELQQQLQAAQARADETRDLYLRTAAELDNVRKRAERDAAAARKYGVERLASDLLAVRDSLELGLAAAADDNAEIKAVVEGMELTLKLLTDVLERYGVTIVDPAGEPFNPDFHQAMSAQESADYPANTVMQVLQKGYRLQDRLLRPALVVVAKAPASP
ncbi:MAG: nucleotide exchange factor GrpE [Nevskiales bacterium]